MTSNDEGKARGGGPTRLKDDIDRGRTKDKVPQFDPAAAPLGTDDEAAGVGPSQSGAEDELRRQRREVADASSPASFTDLRRRNKGLVLALILVAALVVIFLVTMMSGPAPE